jgi:hypothetical protein
VNGSWVSDRAAPTVSTVRLPCGRERRRGVRPWARLGIGIEVGELPRPDPAQLDARRQVGASDLERVPACGELALMDQAVERPDRNSKGASGFGRIEPFVLIIDARHLASASAGHVLDAPHQLTCIDFESNGQPGDGVEAGVPLATFQAAHVGPGDSGTVRERFLGQPLAKAFAPDPITEEPLAGRRSLPGSGHHVIKRLRSIGVDAIGVTLSSSQREGWV